MLSRQGRVVGWCEHGNEPSSSINVGKFSTILGTISFSVSTLLLGFNWSSYGTVLARYLTFVSLCKIQQHLSTEWLQVRGNLRKVAGIFVRLTNRFQWHSAVSNLKKAGRLTVQLVHADGLRGSVLLTLPQATLLCLTLTDFRTKHSMIVARAGIEVVFAGSCRHL
jgi:hypothetical protein